MFNVMISLGYIDASKPLHKNSLFWFAIILPICVSLLLSIPLMKDLNLTFSGEGYNLFLTTFKFPLWISSSSLIFGIMVGRFHGSAQRAERINQGRSQNNFSNYLSHRDHFQKYMQSVSHGFDLSIDAFKIYGIVFSKSTPERVDTAKTLKHLKLKTWGRTTTTICIIDKIDRNNGRFRP